MNFGGEIMSMHLHLLQKFTDTFECRTQTMICLKFEFLKEGTAPLQAWYLLQNSSNLSLFNHFLMIVM